MPSRQREQELEATRAQQKSAAELQAKLKADIAAIGQDRSKLNAQLIDIAAQVRGVETRIDDAEARLRPLDSREQQIRGSLDSRRSEIVEVLAALQRAGRRTAAGAAGAGRKTRCNRCAPRCCSAPWCPKCAGARRNWPATSPNWWRCARPSPASATGLRPTATSSGRTRPRLAALVDERQRKQSAVEKDMEAEGAARHRAVPAGRQPAGT